MNRREFLQAAGVASASLALLKTERLEAEESAGWRTFEVTTRVEVLNPSGATRVWVPTAQVSGTPYQKVLSNDVRCGRRHREKFQHGGR